MIKILEKQIGAEWANTIISYLPENYFSELGKELAKEYKTKTIFPLLPDIFNAFKFTPYDKVNVVFLGLNPYIKEGQAYGVSFGIQEECPYVPPSLRNIDKEVENDIYDGFHLAFDYTLKSWCDQGCFMYNTALTVIEGKTGSHLKLWSPFTEAVFKGLNNKEFCIYVLLGKVAQGYAKFIDIKEGHYIIEAPHPAAEAYAGGTAGFFGSKIFSQINKILIDNGRNQIKW